MSDSKGAAIERQLKSILENGFATTDIKIDRILAILAQEVKRVHEQGIADGIESCINSGHIFKVAEKPPQRERLG